MYQTHYHRPSTVQEAVSLIQQSNDGKFVSGGQTLVPAMKLRFASPSDLVDLRHINELRGIETDADKIVIGATTTHAEVADSNPLKARCPSISQLAGMIGDAHVRHMGTIGGSLANNDPSADYPAAIMALDAVIITDQRRIQADDFFIGIFETALQDDEIITAIEFNVPVKSGYAKFPVPASRYAMAGVFIVTDSDNTSRVAITGANIDGVVRHTGMEKALEANWSEAAIDACTVDEKTMMSDMHANARYRAHLVKVMAKRALAAAS